ncbi:hypothetical protein [Paraburkholderia atlantica]|uniref:hypothetical protein n=1 Tax=Paraburkholderia atlantica TaxID=2654982 RepID=UPI00161B425F|nr:hypothetical protein [Paraburkholderia atlantica]MBB5414089.1 hypothetical protein [Paraburkholderia atlantica]
MSEGFLPMDHVRVKATGEDLYVNSAHYVCLESGKPRQMFSVCRRLKPGETRKLYYADECELIHRHDFQPYKGILRCGCGQVYTTMADTMMPRGEVTWN